MENRGLLSFTDLLKIECNIRRFGGALEKVGSLKSKSGMFEVCSCNG